MESISTAKRPVALLQTSSSTSIAGFKTKHFKVRNEIRIEMKMQRTTNSWMWTVMMIQAER
jgi:hypothetical protein